jgi:hypothetical protein
VLGEFEPEELELLRGKALALLLGEAVGVLSLASGTGVLVSVTCEEDSLSIASGLKAANEAPPTISASRRATGATAPTRRGVDLIRLLKPRTRE